MNRAAFSLPPLRLREKTVARSLRRVRGGFELAHQLVIRKVFERPASQNNHSELAREKSV
jgi:hypothetical protein